MAKKKDTKHVNHKNVNRDVVYLTGTEKEKASLDREYQIQLHSIVHHRLAKGIDAGVPTELLQGAAKGTGLIELKIKSKDSIRCFYSLSEPELVIVAIIFKKKQKDQATKEVQLAVKRLKAYLRQKK